MLNSGICNMSGTLVHRSGRSSRIISMLVLVHCWLIILCGDIIMLCQSDFVKAYTNSFMRHLFRMDHLDQLHQARLYVAGLREQLKLELEICMPETIESTIVVA